MVRNNNRIAGTANRKKVIGMPLLLAVISLLFFIRTEGLAQYMHPGDISKIKLKAPVFTYDPRVSDRRIPIIYYHQTPPNFAGIVDFLLAFRFTFITMDDLYNYFNGRSALPKKPVILQFDDGASDVYTSAFPVVKSRRIKATLYLCTYFIEHQSPPPGEPGRVFSPLTWSQVQEMADSGCIDVQSHTHNHYNLSSLSRAQIDSELVISKRLLETRLHGINVRHAAYPFSGYNQLVMERVRALGYLTGRAGGNQEDGISNRQQTGMYTTIAENIFALKVLWTAHDLFADQSTGRICPNDNLLPEPGFSFNNDEGILGWTTTLNGNGSVTFPFEGYSGGKCVKITRSDNLNQTYYISRRIPLEYNGSYIFGCRIKTDQVTSARFSCVFWKADLTTVAATVNYADITGTQNWKDFSFQFNNNGYYAVDVRVWLNNSTGTAWFDDISFKKKLSN
ncbi:MAG: polysaccharide deacetylase family protein [Bacillota bacterium]